MRPIVYPAAGSHATFYDSTVYVENGQRGSGVGCDNTSEPLRRSIPRPALLPDPGQRARPFKWLSYEGRWGQREAGFNNGPTGPATKTVWRQPFTWMSEQRTTSPRLPGGSIVGPQVTGAFCGAVAFASDLINLNQESTPALIATILALLVVIGLFVGFTRWRPVQIERAAHRARLRPARAGRAAALRSLLADPPPGRGAGDRDRRRHQPGRQPARQRLGRQRRDRPERPRPRHRRLIETLGRPVAQAIVAAIVIVVVRLVVEARDPTFRAAFGGMRERIWRVVFAQLLATLGVIAMALTIVGIPFALWKLVGWAFVQQEVLFTDKSLPRVVPG